MISEHYAIGYTKGTLEMINKILPAMPQSKEREEIALLVKECLEVVNHFYKND